MALPALGGMFGGGLTGGSAGPSAAGDSKGGIDGNYGITSPVVVGGFKSDGSAAAGAVLPAWFAPAALIVGIVAAVALFRKK